tara:strand:+ start:889 stop:1140 length:252 start_codon:yes stop_codon:yes gene_type:complete
MTKKKQKKALARRNRVTKEANIQRNKSNSQKRKEVLAEKERAEKALEMSAQRTAEISSLLHSRGETLGRYYLANLNKTYGGQQ